ncbi:MAG: DUF2130 domain-containing protein [Clostridiales bacterium]|jgi:hypothetical protein|nr:DUF2130 domain-containing protein [Clostridiales bacterium]
MSINIVCPHCGETLDESVLSKITDHKTELAVQRALESKQQELDKRIKEQQESYQAQIKKEKELAEATAKLSVNEQLNKYQLELEELKRQKAQIEEQKKKDLETWVQQQKSLIKETELQKDNEKQQALAQTQQELEVLKVQLKQAQDLHNNEVQKVKLSLEKEKQEEVFNLVKQNTDQQEQIKQEFGKQIATLEYEVKRKQEELEQEKLFKSKLNIKLRGENLEQHCLTEFELHRAQFPYAYFDKDNQVVENAKGDFVYRDYTDSTKKVELLSIMFEMKNQNKDSVTKQTNKQFLGKLDKDRQNKSCEYAVLVTMLEEDNPLYDNGIYKSYDYDKMYIIRPQYFIALIQMLKDAAMTTANQKQELEIIKNQNYELTEFERRLNQFKEDYSSNYNTASKFFESTINEIDKSIKSLEKTKENIQKTARQLGLANSKIEKVNIKKLTKGLPSVKQKMLEQSLNDIEPDDDDIEVLEATQV